MKSASGDLHFGDGTYGIDHFVITRDEGRGTGAFSYNAARHEIKIDHVETTLSPEGSDHLDRAAFPRARRAVSVPSPAARPGQRHRATRRGKQTHLQLDISAPGGMDYTFIDKVLPFDQIAGTLLFTDDRLQIVGPQGHAFRRRPHAAAPIFRSRKTITTTPPTSRSRRSIFPALTDLYFKYKTARGELGGSFDFGGIGDQKKALCGKGKVEVRNGNVFAIPVFGPLSELLSKFFTGAGYSVAHEATAPFSIRDGVIHTDKLKVAGKLFAHGRPRRYQFRAEQSRLRHPDRRHRARRAAHAALPAFRISRERQPNEAGLATETF